MRNRLRGSNAHPEKQTKKPALVLIGETFLRISNISLSGIYYLGRRNTTNYIGRREHIRETLELCLNGRVLAYFSRNMAGRGNFDKEFL